ncbi:FAD:protein FMN transferase [Thorsellia kenyensis]|uniref:FAD:protein FMN transferase n=1 Tax=Thorsellia kenyensis TaxID=1549888 RepID=A0ABV6CCM3_9GAMM
MQQGHIRTVHAVMMGSDISIKSRDADAETLKKALQLVHHYEKKLSANNSDSQLMKINQMAGKAPVSVSEDLFELITIAKEASLMPGSLFNFAIGPLVKLWKIGFSGHTIPNEKIIQETLLRCLPSEVLLDFSERTVYLQQIGMEIDLGAIAKGYIADMVRAYLVSQSVNSALIDLGGNIHSLSQCEPLLAYNESITELSHNQASLINPKCAKETQYVHSLNWSVGIKTPFCENNKFLGILNIENESVVTTGIYERFFIKNNHHYHHVLNTLTGYPHDNDLVSVTVISKRSTEGEIWSTLLYGLGLEKGLEAVKNNSAIEAIFITRKNEVVISDKMKVCFELLDQHYTLL